MSKQFEPKQFIHYDPERVDYSVTPHELEQLKQAARNHWKDFCLVLAPLGLSCLVNASISLSDQAAFSITLPIFLNTLLGILSIILAICSGVLWHKSSGNLDKLIKTIEGKPKLPIVPTALKARALPAGSITISTVDRTPSASLSPSTSSSPSSDEDE